MLGLAEAKDRLTDELATSIAETILSHVKPRSGRTGISVSVDDLTLGYSYCVCGFFPHEMRGLKRIGRLDVTVEDLMSGHRFSFEAVLREDPSLAPVADGPCPFSAN